MRACPRRVPFPRLTFRRLDCQKARPTGGAAGRRRAPVHYPRRLMVDTMSIPSSAWRSRTGRKSEEYKVQGVQESESESS